MDSMSGGREEKSRFGGGKEGLIDEWPEGTEQEKPTALQATKCLTK